MFSRECFLSNWPISGENLSHFQVPRIHISIGVTNKNPRRDSMKPRFFPAASPETPVARRSVHHLDQGGGEHGAVHIP